MQQRVIKPRTTHQLEQLLQLCAALDHSARQDFTLDLDAMPAEHLLEAAQRDAIGVFGGRLARLFPIYCAGLSVVKPVRFALKLDDFSWSTVVH